MLTGAIRSIAVGGAALIILGTSASIALASPPVGCQETDARTGVCIVWVSGGSSSAGTPRAQGTSSSVSEESNPDPCIYAMAQPQPSASDPVWQGHSAADGAIYVETCPRPPTSAANSDGTVAFFGTGWYFALLFEPTGFAPAAQPADPRVLAQQAMAALRMQAPQIGLAPPAGTAAVIGNPVWMWIGRGQDLTGPTRASASAGGITVTAVATVTQVLWSMGDGHTVACGAGTPYSPGAAGPSPDCGYTYSEASSLHAPGGGPWPITAAATWTITWAGGGASGSQSMTLSSAAELHVDNVFVLNQDGGG